MLRTLFLILNIAQIIQLCSIKPPSNDNQILKLDKYSCQDGLIDNLELKYQEIEIINTKFTITNTIIEAKIIKLFITNNFKATNMTLKAKSNNLQFNINADKVSINNIKITN